MTIRIEVCMIIFILLIFFIIIVLYFISNKKYKSVLGSYSKDDNQFLILYPLALLVMDVARKVLGESKEQAQISRFNKLYPRGNGKDEYRRFVLNRNSVIILIVCLILALSLVSEISSHYKEGILTNNTLRRPMVGETNDISLKMYTERYGKRDLELWLNPRRLRDAELDEYLKGVIEALVDEALGENASFDHVTKPLVLADEVADPNVQARWHPEDTSLINIMGNVYNEDVDEEGVITYLTLILAYYGEDVMEHVVPLKVFPTSRTDDELFTMEVEKIYQEVEKDSAYDERISLPTVVANEDIYWEESKENKTTMFAIYGIIASVIVYFMLMGGIGKKEKAREKQMILDYSNIIGKFTLFLSAGMTIRGAWENIACEYERNQAEGKNRTKPHFAYEEMLRTLNELRVGVSEAAAYENFGRKCMLVPYLKFVSIITQNLKKGTTGILPLLEVEKKQAFTERKELSRRLGEEAGTRLQAPLMLYLVVVLVAVLMPAFMSL